MSAVKDVVRGAEEISKQTEDAISEVVKAVTKVETGRYNGVEGPESGRLS